MSATRAKRKLQEKWLKALTGLGKKKDEERMASPGLQALRSRTGVLSTRKSRLFDRYEHRYIVSSKWDWITVAVTLFTAIVSLGIELMYCSSEDFYHVDPGLKYSYLVCTYIFSAVPYVMMILKSLEDGGGRKAGAPPRRRSLLAPRRTGVPVLGAALVALETLFVVLLVLPVWFFVGLGLYGSKLIVVTAVAKAWWGVLSKFIGVRYKSINDDLAGRTARLNTNDVDNMMPIRASARKPRQRGGQRSIVEQIKRKASARQKRMAGGLELALPRQDLAVDVALLSKIVLVELFVKYVPQYALFFVINSRSLFGETKETLTVLSAVSQTVIMVGSIVANWKVFRDRKWASNFQNINSTLGGLFGSPKPATTSSRARIAKTPSPKKRRGGGRRSPSKPRARMAVSSRGEAPATPRTNVVAQSPSPTRKKKQ